MQLVKCDRAAAILDVRPQSLRDPRFRQRIGLKAVRVGRALRFRITDLERLAERGEERVPVGVEQSAP